MVTLNENFPESAETTTSEENLAVLHAELDWLKLVIDQVIRSYLKQEGHESHWTDIIQPDLTHKPGIYSSLVNEWQLSIFERLAVALSLAPHLRPDLLDVFFGQNQLLNRSFSEFGGVTGKSFGGFIPTGQTLSFLISGNDPLWGTQLIEILDPRNRLMAEQVLSLEPVENTQPRISGVLSLSDQWLHYFISGKNIQPEFSTNFPAHPITTPLNWEDLVLEYSAMSQVQEIQTWLIHGETLMQDWGLEIKVKPGYRVLFYGPPGTGKTLTATLLAKVTGRELYRVDLSMIVSKYIGETEKNLSKVFNAASHQDWILFFDEADALFGKRTAVTSSNDRHANQQVSYLLQRIEEFSGVVILSSNLKANMDDAFARRFQSMIHFSMPAPEQRLLLWRKAFAGTCKLAEDVDLVQIAEDYELSGGAINNILRHCAISAINRDSMEVSNEELIAGIRREYKKENRTT